MGTPASISESVPPHTVAIDDVTIDDIIWMGELPGLEERASLAGIGFTVALFVTELAFTEAVLADSAKLGIFIGSFIAGVAGYTILRRSKNPRQVAQEKLKEAEAAEALT